MNVPVQAAQIGIGSPGLLRLSTGGASEEIDVRDAGTGEQIVAIATYNSGLLYNIAGSYLEYGHACQALRIASKVTRDQIVKGGPTSASVPGSARPTISLQNGQAVAAR